MANIAGIMELYTAYFNRAADKNGVDYWANEMDNNGWTLDDVANTFAQQPEYTALYDGKTNQEIVDLVYTNVLNRDADAAGAEYWLAELDSGAVTVSQFILAVVNSATEMVDGVYKHPTDAAIVNNKTAVSQYAYDTNSNATDISLAEVTDDEASTQSAKNQIDAENPANIGETFTLTAGTANEILVGTTKNDTFVGDKDSIDGTDKLVDGSSTDNDTANLSFNDTLPSLTIANVENVNVTLSNIGATSVNATNFSGVKNLTVTKDNVTVGTSTLAGNKAVAVTAVNAENVAKITAGAGTTDVTVDQATKVGVTVDADTATGVVEISGAATVNAANATKVNLSGDVDATKAVVINAAKATTINVGSNTDGGTAYDNTAVTGAITINAAAATSVKAAVSGGATIVAKDGVTVTAVDDSGVSITTSLVGTTTTKGAISITGTAGTTDTATISAAGIQVLTNTNVDELTLSGNGAAATYEVSSGAASKYTVSGDQAVTISASAANLSAKTVTGAKEVKITTGASALDASKYSNVEKISVGADISGNKITVVDGQTVEFTSATQTGLDFDYATGAKNVNIIVGDVNGTSSAVGTLTVGAFDASAAAADVGNVTITANESNFTATSTTIGAKQTLVLTGDEDFTLGQVTAKAIDASAVTGIVSASNGAGAAATVTSITTGTGKDTLTTNTTSVIRINSNSGDDTITLTKAGATSEIVTADGNDTVNIASVTADAAFVVSTEAGDDIVSIDGAIDAVLVAGEGSDTLKVTADADFKLKNNFTISGFEKLDLSSVVADIDVVLTAAQFANNSTLEVAGTDANDTLTIVAASTGSVIDGSNLTIKSGATATINYTGSAKADTITGGAANENFTQTEGADSYEGGAGTDTITLAALTLTDEDSIGSVINLGTTAISQTAVYAAISGYTASTTVAAGTIAYVFADNDSSKTYSTDVDTISGFENVIGSSGADYIVGSASNNVLSGGSGNDYINGGDGNDTITGGAGVDTLVGGLGADTFVFATADIDTTAGAVTDKITDFKSSEGDKLKLGAAGDATLITGNYLEAGAAVADLATLLGAADTALDGTVKYYLGQVTGGASYLVIDTNGTGYTDVIELTGVTLATFAATDIIA